MKKLRLLLVFAIFAVSLLVTSCTALGIGSVQVCAVHRDINKDNICDVCGFQMPATCKRHEDLDHDGMCDNYEICDVLFKVVHFDDDHDGECDEIYCMYSGMKIEHYDDDFDRICDECDADIEIDCECYDDDLDGFCDECEYPFVICNHKDKNNDGICDLCREDMPAPPVCNHKDKDSNGVCDSCKEPMAGTIPLVDSKGKTSFKIVLGKGLDGSSRKRIEYLISELDGLGVDISENSGDEAEYEILIGEVSKRDAKYTLDVHDYGLKGYTMQVIDKKIIVLAGQSATYVDLVEKLRTEFFGINDVVSAKGSLTNVHLYTDKNITYVQNDYGVSQITLFGEDIRSYKLVYDSDNSNTKNAAAQLQNLLYEKTGYWLESVSSLEEGEKGIFFNVVDKVGDDGFEAIFESGKITFNSEYGTSIKKVPLDYFRSAIDALSGGAVLSLNANNGFTKNAHYVYYDDFGAVGDGVTNDADAIYEAHQFAVDGRHKKIVGTPGKTYLIGELTSKNACPIQCDVDWTDVKFILDDREGVITNGYRGSVFSVTGSSTTSVSPTKTPFVAALNAAGGFKASELERFDLGLGYQAMVIVANSSHKYFIREGVNANEGTTQREIILVDADGNIDPKVRFLFDYEKVTGISAYRVDPTTITPITITGGEFTTKAHNQTTTTTYTGQRGIIVYRANTTIQNLKHYITGEVSGDKGSAYPNFIDVQNAYNVLIEDCVFTGHKTYYNIKGTSKVGLGTYDITTHTSLEVTWKNCTQSNFYNDPNDPSKGRPSQYWGINGGGESKRVTYDGCTLSRFDAHTGIMHAYIIDSIVGSVDLTGGGNLHIINSMVYGSPMIRFREDYGAFWIGDVIIKDSAIVETSKDKTITTAQMFNTSWVNHYFGYKTSLPQSIIIDNLRVLSVDQKTLSTAAKSVYMFASSFVSNSDKYGAEIIRQQNADGTFSDVPNKNIMTPPGKIIIRNNHQGLSYSQLDTMKEKEFFKDTYTEVMPITTPPACAEHVDADRNFVCDNCWEYISAMICTKHYDADKNGICDTLSCKTQLNVE